MALSLSSLLSVLKGGSQEGSVVGVDIGASSIKVVQLRSSHGSAVLETYGELALGPYAGQPIGKVVKLPPEKLTEALKDLMKEANITTNLAGVSVPFASSLVSVIDVPKVDNDALKRIIPIEARKYIPVPVNEVMLDWLVIPAEEKQDSAFDRIEEKTPIQAKGQEGLLVAIHNNVLQTYQAVMQGANLTPAFFEIEFICTIRAALGHGLSPYMFVDIGAGSS